MKVVKLLLLVSTLALTKAQNAFSNDESGSTFAYLNYVSGKVEQKFFFYPEKYTLKKSCKDTIQCKSVCPEALLKSLLSANNYKWYNSLHYKKDYLPDSIFQKRFKMGGDSDEMELICKVEFTDNNTSYAMVKFYIHHLNSVATGCMLLKKDQQKWMIESEIKFQDLSKILYFYDNKIVKQILIDRKSDDPSINAAILAAYQGDFFQENIFIETMYQKLGNGIVKFKDPNTTLNIFEK